ncbi:MAG TPA: PfkB family carbohydrate kinase [Sedimentisphaerales bacterium]|nr:PfkB family carbohydrate kinase [Sedimentisphaerales bacterium]
MSLLVTGSIGIDTVETPYGVSENCLGGSAIYFSMAASFFTPVRLIGVIGADCPFDLAEVFAGRQVDLAGLEVRELSKTFRWKGSYHDTAGSAITDNVELNVLAEAPPNVPDSYKDSRFVFLANTAPDLQRQLLQQVQAPAFVAADTMNCWIDSRPDELKALLKAISCLVINEDEARALSAERNLTKAAENILAMGPRIAVIKRGEAGSIMFSANQEKFLLPAFPTSQVKDPTGAGDSFAGAMMGYLAQTDRTDFEALKTALAYGTVAASFAIAEFSLQGLTSVTRPDIDGRFEALRKMTQF